MIMSEQARKNTLTAVVIAKDEARHIAACLESVRLLTDDLLVVLDDRTTDDTARLAEAAGARVVVSRFVNFSAQRNRALEEAVGDYVFFIDADELCTPELAAEITTLLAVAEPPAGGWTPRRNYFFGKLVNYAGWWPDYQLRLLRREGTRYDEGREVHEEAIPSGPSVHLTQPLTHYNYDTWAQFRRKQRYYAAFEASILHNKGQRAKLRNFILQPLREFRRRYVTLGGWRGGLLGLALSLAMAWYELRKYWLLRGLGRLNCYSLSANLNWHPQIHRRRVILWHLLASHDPSFGFGLQCFVHLMLGFVAGWGSNDKLGLYVVVLIKDVVSAGGKMITVLPHQYQKAVHPHLASRLSNRH